MEGVQIYMRNVMKSSLYPDSLTAHRYESVFCIFLVILAFLWRDNPNLVYPQILWLFTLLLALNLLAGVSLRFWPSIERFSTLIILANCATITTILSYSGGHDSNLWVLYLLPIYTTCMLLGTREVVLITTGVISFNALYYLFSVPSLAAEATFALAIKSGIFVFAAAATWRIAHKERMARQRLESQRRETGRMADKIKIQEFTSIKSAKIGEMEFLASGFAHDLKNSLTVILGTAEILLQNESHNPGFKPDLERIRKMARLCKSIVTQFLESTKGTDIKFYPCDINDILSFILSLYASTLVKSHIAVRREFAENLPKVAVSPFHLHRVFLNLMFNARDAMRNGGTLTVRTEAIPFPKLQGLPWIQVVMEDTGTGIAEEALRNLFRPFRTTKTNAGGTGLGLYICNEIVTKHGGSLKAENRTEGGARFLLCLPPYQAGTAEVPSGVTMMAEK